MLPEPLHPAVVHFPIVLVTLLPIAAAWALWRVHRGTPARQAWWWPVTAAAALTVSAFAALQTGEAQEDRVQPLVAEQPFETHEEAGERFAWLSAAVLLVMAGGLLPGVAGRATRGLAMAGTVALVVAGVQVGHSGGQLAYRHGAAAAWSAATAHRPALRQRDSDDLD